MLWGRVTAMLQIKDCCQLVQLALILSIYSYDRITFFTALHT